VKVAARRQEIQTIYIYTEACSGCVRCWKRPKAITAFYFKEEIMKKQHFRKLLIVVLALVVAFAFSACGGNDKADTGTANQDAGDASDAADAGDAGDSGQKYVLKFSTNDSADSNMDKGVIQPLQKLLEDKSNGQISLEVFYSSSLANMGTCLEGMKNGQVDMGFDVLTMYPGQYLYTELLGTPGIQLGSGEDYGNMLKEYIAAYPETGLDDFKIIARFTSGAFGDVTKKAVKTVADLKGLTLRASTNFSPWYEAMGASATMMPPGDIYEGMKLSVIDGAHTSLMGVFAFSLFEVADYYTTLPMTNGDQLIAMSKTLYDSMSPDLQKIIDEVADEMLPLCSEYVTGMEATAKDNIISKNDKFEFIELAPDAAAAFSAAAEPLLEAKAKELDDAGLDGTGALAWLKDHAVK
jgi:TRAP-type C4-dicarboxylate transport system substrate-binding protein